MADLYVAGFSTSWREPLGDFTSYPAEIFRLDLHALQCGMITAIRLSTGFAFADWVTHLPGTMRISCPVSPTPFFATKCGSTIPPTLALCPIV